MPNPLPGNPHVRNGVLLDPRGQREARVQHLEQLKQEAGSAADDDGEKEA